MWRRQPRWVHFTGRDEALGRITSMPICGRPSQKRRGMRPAVTALRYCDHVCHRTSWPKPSDALRSGFVYTPSRSLTAVHRLTVKIGAARESNGYVRCADTAESDKTTDFFR